MRDLSIIAAAFLGVSLAACAAQPPTRETVGEAVNNQSDSAPPEAKEGEDCGGSPGPGIVGSKCAAGLICDHPNTNDAPGHCKLAP